MFLATGLVLVQQVYLGSVATQPIPVNKHVAFMYLPFKVKAIFIHPELFSVENGLLTPTLKAKRNELRQIFRPQLDQLYAGIKL